MTCKNCGQPVEYRYCGHCGQDAGIGRINWQSFLSDLSHSILYIDKGFLFTVKQLFLRPGTCLRDYLAGRRKLSFKPVGFVLILATLYFLVTRLLDKNTWLDDLVIGFIQGATNSESTENVPEILIWFSESYAYSILLLLPVFSLSSFLAFRKFGYNYLEHMVMNCFLTGQQAIFYTLFVLIGVFIESKILGFLPFVTTILYCGWAFWDLYEGETRIWIVLRTLLTYLLYLFMAIALAIALFAVLKIGL